MHNKDMYGDNEYRIMSEILDDRAMTQRQISKKLGLSVSTVNVLINKMAREGLIKIQQVSKKQVMYMLTPAGIAEKAKKTVGYLQGHYRIINETKKIIKETIQALRKDYDMVYVLLCDHEMGEITKMAIDELGREGNWKTEESEDEVYGEVLLGGIWAVESVEEVTRSGVEGKRVLLHMKLDEEEIEKYREIKGLEVVGLLEKL